LRMGTSGSEIARGSGKLPLEMVSTEKNIEESYLFAGGANEANETREHVVTVTLEDGTQATRRFKYTPSKEYGDTTDVDRDVYRAIMLLAHQNGGMPADGVVHFSLYQLRKILNLPDKGESYRKIKNSIVKLQTLSVNADTYWQGIRSFKSEYYSMFNRANFEANEGRFGRAIEHHWVRFDDVIVRSYHEGYVRDLDHNFYFSLNKKHSRGLYSMIDLERGKGLVWEIPLSELATRLGMAKSYKSPSAKKRALASAHDEMKRKGFLARMSFPDNDTVRYEVAEDFVVERTFLGRRWTPEEEATIQALVSNDVRVGAARELVAKKGVVLCNYYLRALPYQKGIRSPGAFLYKAISEERALHNEPPQRHLEEADVVPEYRAFARAFASAAAGGEARAAAPSGSAPPLKTDSGAKEVWDLMLADCEEQIDVSSLRVWFQETVPAGLEGGRLTIGVPNTFAKDYIETRFKDTLVSALRGHVGEGAELEVVVGGNA
jgi:replication initiator protein A/DnaA-like protein